MLSLLVSKRKIAFFLSLDSHRKKLCVKHFCLSFIEDKRKNFHTRTGISSSSSSSLEDQIEYQIQMNHLNYEKISKDVIDGQFYKQNYEKVFN